MVVGRFRVLFVPVYDTEVVLVWLEISRTPAAILRASKQSHRVQINMWNVKHGTMK